MILSSCIPLKNMVVIADERFLIAVCMVAVGDGFSIGRDVEILVEAIVGGFALPFCGGPGDLRWIWIGRRLCCCCKRWVDKAVGLRDRIGWRRHGDAVRDGGQRCSGLEIGKIGGGRGFWWRW